MNVGIGPNECRNWAEGMSELGQMKVRIGPNECPNWAKSMSDLGQMKKVEKGVVF